MYSQSAFSRFAKWTSRTAGHPSTFTIMVAIVLIWALSGPLFGFSDTWQLVINTATAILTFLMVFLIQNTQNRDSAAIQLKLDDLIRATDGAHNILLDIEELDDAELERLRQRYEELARHARDRMRSGEPDTTSQPIVIS